jgi:hypothetical protein
MATPEAKAVDTKMRNLMDSADPNQMRLQSGRAEDNNGASDAALRDVPLRDPTAVDEQFPTSGFVSRDNKKDVVMSYKLGSQNGGAPGVTPFGQLIAKDSDFEWLRQKREEQEYANFQQWFALNFDKMSPEQKKIARDLFPTFYQERLKQLGKSVDLQHRIAKLKLLGIQDRDDLLLQYGIESGYIAADPLENILHPERSRVLDRQYRFTRGILNPRRLMKGDWGLETRATNARVATGRNLGVNEAYGLGTGGRGFAVANLAGPAAESVQVADGRQPNVAAMGAGLMPFM